MSTYTIDPERLAELDTITLDRGAHASFNAGHCAMEVVSYLAGLGFTDAPECASRVIRTFTIGLNDGWGYVQRQKLVPFLPRMIGTAGDGHDEARSYMALDWLIRTYTPAFLDLAGLSVEAQALRDLRRIVDMASAEAAGPAVWASKAQAAAAWDAAGAARDAWDAAGDAARAAAWDAVWDAAGAAGAAGAVWDAARDAARAAARDAGDAAWDAARAAAGQALAPTVETLKTSALTLLDQMLTIGGK